VKIRASIKRSSAWPLRQAGLTILEMLVSTAMLSFIVLGLTAMLIQTQKAFKTGIKQNTITDSGRAIMDMITGDLRQMSDAQNPYITNFFWGAPNIPMVTNYENGVAIRTNELNDIFILEHTNTTWLGVGYSVSNYSTNLGVGALYRYETSTNSLAPLALTNDLYYPFYTNVFFTPTFPNFFWHKVADGVIDLKIRAFDQFGNENDYNFNGTFFSYPIRAYGIFPASNTIPNSVELEFGILEPDVLVQVRSLAGNPTALMNFLSTNSAPKMEVFRQRVTIAAAIQ
jgi:type II secretory pathway pseudopilin PulG